MKFAFIFLTFTFILLTNSASLIAQNSSKEPFIAQSESSGEETIKELEEIAGDAKNTGERLFVIARLSKAEKSNRISLVRLAYTRTFLLQMRQFPFQTAVFAEGDRVDGEGRIEFYLGSHLRLVTLAKRNKIPNLTCCEDYTPPVKSKPRRKKSKN
jgi:hypothetical protein